VPQPFDWANLSRDSRDSDLHWVLLPIVVLELVGLLLLNRQCEQHPEDIGASEDVRSFVEWECVVLPATMHGP